MLATVGWSPALAAEEDAAAFAHVNREQLRRDLTRALPDGLAWSDDKLALSERGEPYWLPAVRAKKTGFYILRHSFRYDQATRGELGKGGQHHVVYYFYVGKTGASRVHFAHTAPAGSSQFDGRFPTACEGDLVVAPFRVAANQVDHAFWHDGPDEKRTSIIRSMIGEPARWLRDVADSSTPGCELVNQAEPQLRLLGTKMERGLSRSSFGPTFYEWIAAFEARRVGEFNLQFVGPRGGKVPPPLPIRIVAATTSLRVVLTNYEKSVYEKSGAGITSDGFPASGHVLRVGDQFRITCLSQRHSATDERPPIVNPPITARAEPFVLARWLPFGIEPAERE